MVACHSDPFAAARWSSGCLHRHSGECRYRVAMASDHTGADVLHRHSGECRYKVAMASDHTGADFPHRHSGECRYKVAMASDHTGIRHHISEHVCTSGGSATDRTRIDALHQVFLFRQEGDNICPLCIAINCRQLRAWLTRFFEVGATSSVYIVRDAFGKVLGCRC
jgi:hypothetical protein